MIRPWYVPMIKHIGYKQLPAPMLVDVAAGAGGASFQRLPQRPSSHMEVHRTMRKPWFVPGQSLALVLSLIALSFSLEGRAGDAAARLNSSSQAHTAQVTARGAFLQTSVTWHSLSLINGWVSFNPALAGEASYGTNGNGIVYLRGAISSISRGPCRFAVLPAGNRPSHQLWFPIYTDGNTEGTLIITGDGRMCVLGPSSPNLSSLDGVEFPVGS